MRPQLWHRRHASRAGRTRPQVAHSVRPGLAGAGAWGGATAAGTGPADILESSSDQTSGPAAAVEATGASTAGVGGSSETLGDSSAQAGADARSGPADGAADGRVPGTVCGGAGGSSPRGTELSGGPPPVRGRTGAGRVGRPRAADVGRRMSAAPPPASAIAPMPRTRTQRGSRPAPTVASTARMESATPRRRAPAAKSGAAASTSPLPGSPAVEGGFPPALMRSDLGVRPP